MKNGFNLCALFFKGMLIGSGAVIPGLSGGTMAVVTNTFEGIVESVANLFNHIKRSLYILVPIALGAIISMIFLSLPLNYFSVEFPLLSKITFLQISLFSIFFFAKSSIEIKITIGKALSFISGILISFLISYMTEYIYIFDIESKPIFLILIGFPLAIALVLPGISFSYMLLFFGIYEKTLSAIHTLDLYYLIFLFIGVAFGTFVCSKLLLKLIENHKQETYSFVLGFVVNSMIDMLIN